MMARIAAVPAAVALAAALAGCETASYLSQSVRGHFDLMSRQRAVTDLLSDPATTAQLKGKLELAEDARSFAVDGFALPDNGSYRTYADLERPYVTWTVVVTPRLSLLPMQWCFPVAGCVTYRGYFHQADAREFAARFSPDEFDTYVGGATAYSTLGWFSDPLLNTMMSRGDLRLAAVVFHELAHQRLYLPGDTTFNESYAVAVERLALGEWLRRRGESSRLDALADRAEHRRAFNELVSTARRRLAAIYASARTDAQKLADKAATFAWMNAQHDALRAQWGGKSPYDGWFAIPLNNARLALFSAYEEYVGAFLALYEQVGRDPAAFHAASERLAGLTATERRAELERLQPSKRKVSAMPGTVPSSNSSRSREDSP